IPVMTLTEAQKIIGKEYKVKCVGAPDLDPKQEKLICEYTTKKH
ncbi:aspartate--tRNA(Asn) ligase, partial [bacterium (Candidatus Howlettbacteria) CG_4_10_14_0_8_um_filter_40_9]